MKVFNKMQLLKNGRNCNLPWLFRKLNEEKVQLEKVLKKLQLEKKMFGKGMVSLTLHCIISSYVQPVTPNMLSLTEISGLIVFFCCLFCI